MKSQLIINADDFGMSEGVVDSILSLASRGVVTSTTLMATAPAFDYAIKSLNRSGLIGRLSVGIHLDATTGKPILEAETIPSLIGSDGLFIQRIERDSTRSIVPEELYREFKAQIERTITSGLRPTHLDNHHNWIYFDSRLFEVLVQLAGEYGLPIRFPFANMSEARSARIAAKLKMPPADLKQAIHDTNRLVAKYEIKTPDTFWIEFTSFDRTSQALEDFISNLPHGIHELCIHPGTDSDRQLAEREILSQFDPDRFKRLNPGLELVSYASLGSVQ